MNVFKPISAPADLPKPGARSEDYSIDAKRMLGENAGSIELAKDVAAFANTVGGTILVGADEDARTRCIAYLPLAGEIAHRAAHRYEQAAKEFCRPAPLVAKAIIPYEAGFVAAVNVWPMPGQAVGVRVRLDREANGRGGEAFFFPVRVGSTTSYIEPQQLAMLMLPDVRRIVSLLGNIGMCNIFTDQPNVVDGKSDAMSYAAYVLDRIEPLQNTAVFGVIRTGKVDGMVSVPLDYIRTVYKEPSDRWIVLVDGHFVINAQQTYFVPGSSLLRH